MGTCESTCCGNEGHNVDTKAQQLESVSEITKPFSQANLFDISVPDEKQLKKLEALMNEGCSISQLTREISPDPKLTLKLMGKTHKTIDEYKKLCLKDSELQYRSMEFGSLKFIGQVRQTLVQNEEPEGNQKNNRIAQQGTTPNGSPQLQAYTEYQFNKCGYGKLQWPDGSSFEGYWINGQPWGVGVFRAPEPGCETYEGFWQQDRQTNLSVFRQNPSNDIFEDLNAFEMQSEASQSIQEKQNGLGIEVWSDGSYYHGCFSNGVKEGEGCYYWADGSKYTGMWQADEMSGFGTFQWADGRYFQGSFQNGVMHGFGNYVWQDGRKYEGHYRFNKKHGEGTYTYSDGSKYRGEWVDGMQHGVGCIIDAESTYERKGIWAFGKLKQWLTTQE